MNAVAVPRGAAPWIWLLPALLLLLPGFVLPIALVVRNSLNIDDPLGGMVAAFTIANYADILTDLFYARIFANSLLLSAGCALFCLLICYPVAYHMALRASAPARILFWLVYTPLLVSVMVRVFGWIILISDTGLMNSLLLGSGLLAQPLRWLYDTEGTVIGLVHRYLPLMMLPLYTAMRKIDGALIRASVSLGGSEWDSFRRVVVPLSIPGCVAGLQLVFAGAISDFVLPNLMGGTSLRLLAPTVLSEAVTEVNLARSATLATLMLLGVGIVLVVTQRAVARWCRWAANV